MASEIGKLPIDDIIAHYLRYNDINGAKSRPASTASSSLETKSVAAEKKNAHPVALPGHNPKFDASIHCMNCQTRKFKKGCLFKCCYNCCVYSKATSKKRTDCLIHTAEFDKKLAEQRYIEEALDYEYGSCKDANDLTSGGPSLYYKKKKLKQFVHAEERFSDINQTVVVWCLYDFGMFNKYSGDCFALDVRLKRQEDVRKRREAIASGSSSTAVNVRVAKSFKLSRKDKFDIWHKRVLQSRGVQ